MLYKSDSVSVKYIEELKKENQDLTTIFSWLEEYSNIKFKYKDSKEAKNRLKNSLSNSKDLQKIPLSVVKDILDSTINEKQQGNPWGDMTYINCSDESISLIDSSEFDIFKLQSEVGQENILSTLSCYIFASTGLYSKIKYDKFESFINAIAKNYIKENPYHTDLHASDVLQTCHIYLKLADINKRLRLDEIDHTALLISCIVHDYKHPGVTNLFLVNTGDPIAIKYNGKNTI